MTATKNRADFNPASNVTRKPGTPPKWDEEMQERIINAIREADKAGLPRNRVFQKLADEFNEEYVETYTAHQVASQFHLVKARFGYLVDRQVQGAKPRERAVLAPPTRSKFRDVQKANAKIDSQADTIQRLRSSLAEVRAARNDSLGELQAIKKQLRQAGIVLQPRKAG